MRTAKWLTAIGLTGLSLAWVQAHAETVGINQNGSLVEMCASAEKMVTHDAAMMNVEFLRYYVALAQEKIPKIY